jgi:hypothetical protein
MENKKTKAKAKITRKSKNRWIDPTIKIDYNSGEIITKPNQSMSIRDMLFRNTQGMTYDNYKTPYYEDQASFSSQSLNKIQEMEPVEKLQFLKQLDTQVETLKQKITDHQAAKEAEAKAIAEASNKEIPTEE